MNPWYRLRRVASRLLAILGVPGVAIGAISAISFAFGLFVLSRESDRPRDTAQRTAHTLLLRWVRIPDYLGLTLLDYVDLWREAPEAERPARRSILDSALRRLAGDSEAPSRQFPVLQLDSLELSASPGGTLASWRNSLSGPSESDQIDDRLVLTPKGETPGIALLATYRLDPLFAGEVEGLETAYFRVLLALLGLSGFSLLGLGYLILHTKALSERVAREAASEATLDLADRTCHELGNGVFVMANERRNLAEHLDLLERFLGEHHEALAEAHRRTGLDASQVHRWNHHWHKEVGERGIDPDLELLTSVTVARQVCRQIDACADYIGMTVRELDGFLKHSALPVSLTPVRVVDCVEEAVAILRPRIQASEVELTLKPPADPNALAFADRRLLIHALVNLIKNALEAVGSSTMPPRVSVAIRDDVQGLLIEIRDNGPGLPPGAASHLFELGFSTKAPSRGRGLAIVRDSVLAQRGGIVAENAPEGGACFRISLPRASGPARSSS